MRIRDLGPLIVASGGKERVCAARKQAGLLSMLAINVNQRVSIDDLVTGAWGYDASVSTSTVENHVWRLRRLLDPTYSRASGSPVQNDAGGYRLVLPVPALDSSLFDDLATTARTHLDAGRPAPALEAAESALRLWRGTPYDTVGHVPSTAAAAARLEEIRGQVVEIRIEALIVGREHDRAVADLAVLTEQYPYRERLWGLRMSALTAGGRVEEALQVFARVRGLMREELGIEPGPDLQRLQQSILKSRTGPLKASSPPPAPASPAGPVHLPRRRGRLLGRDGDVKALRADLKRYRLVTVVGAGGSGKTRLAIEVAVGLTERFPDGIWFADLTAVSDPGRVAEAVASTIGLVNDGSDLQRALQAYAGDRRMMMLLDNCEHVLEGAASVAEAMSSTSSDSAVLVTSRQALAVEGERVHFLPPLGIHVEDEAPPALSSAAELFVARLGRPCDDPDERLLVEQICRAVDGLPLAIELAAARVETFSLAEIRDQVTDDPSRLGRIGRSADDHRTSLWSAIDWSHRLLEPADQAVHRRLAVLPGPFTLPAATATGQGDDLDVHDVPEALARLVHRSLLISTPASTAGRPTVFRQLDTVRAHARHLLDQTGELVVTLSRRDQWILQLVASRPRLGDPALKAYYDNLDDAFPAIRAAWQGAVTPEPDLQILEAASSMLYYWYHRNRLVEAKSWMQAVMEAGLRSWSATNPVPELVSFRLALAAIHFLSGDTALARTQLELALPHVDQHPDDRLIGLGELLTAAANTAWARNDYESADQLSTALRGVAARAGDEMLQLFADQTSCVAGLTSRDPRESAAQAESVYARAVNARNLLAQWCACGARMIVAAMTGDPETGIAWVDRLIPAHAALGSGGGGAFLESLANFASLVEDHTLAISMYGAGYAETRRVGMVWPIQLHTEDLVARSRAAVPAERFEELWSAGEQVTYEQVARDRGLTPLA